MFGLFGKKQTTASALPVYFFNTTSGKKELFQPLKNGTVTMYSCGPTVYDHIHIGNLRAYLLPDLAKRVLIQSGLTVKHTINFTDFGHLTDDGDAGEDKMMKALMREGKPITLTAMREVAAAYIASFKKDTLDLRIIPPTTYAAASDYVGKQISLIQSLIDKGYTYETSDGVYFDISKFSAYGSLGNVDIAKLQEGARVEVNREKKHPADFALWKKALLGFDSAWGKGFPGWHIECTAMVFDTLGKQIDIHTGGEDLKYTHHNGEIAQAEALTRKQYVRYWLHNAFITINDTKIAKSAGNGLTLRHLVDKGYAPDVYRYWLLTSHYRTPVNFTFQALDAAKQALFRLKRHIYEDFKNESGDIDETYRQRFLEAVNDDLDTPKAIALMWDLVKDRAVKAESKVATLKFFDSILAIGLSDDTAAVKRDLGVVDTADIPEEVHTLLAEREHARTEKRWEDADELRRQINVLGYTIEDSATGVRITKNG